MNKVIDQVNALKKEFNSYIKQKEYDKINTDVVKEFLLQKGYNSDIIDKSFSVIATNATKSSKPEPKDSSDDSKRIKVLNQVKDIIRTKTTSKQRIDLRRYLENE